MASIYQRPDSNKFHLSCYPRPGAKLIRASLGTDDEVEAARVGHAVELLIELEKLSDAKIPAKLLAELPGVRSLVAAIGSGPIQSERASIEDCQEKPTIRCSIDDAVRSLIIRSMAVDTHHATQDKISKLRQFFGPERINALDPRPEGVLSKRRKVKDPDPWHRGKGRSKNTFYEENDLSEIRAETILDFLVFKQYGRTSKRHYRELFHELFQVALKNGSYVPDNAYAANPADDLPCFKGKDEPIVILNREEEDRQYGAVRSNPLVHFGCQLMIEGGFRLHEILALRRYDLDIQRGKICLRMPKKTRLSSTGLKTGERTVSLRRPLRRMIEDYFDNFPGHPAEWCFMSSPDERMQSDEFGKLLRKLNRPAGLEWTTQDFRHTFATNRIAEGWNLKVLAQEMGTSVHMLMEHYAGYIEPPVLASTHGI